MNFCLIILLKNALSFAVIENAREEEIKEEYKQKKGIDPHVGLYC